MSFKLLSFVISFLIASKCTGSVLPLESFDKFISENRENWKIPGVAVVIVKSGKIYYHKAFGYRDVESGLKVDTNTIFQIGSITKNFTALSALLLDYEKKCSIDDPVKKWYRDFKIENEYSTQHATLQDALSHRLGYQYWVGEFLMFESTLTEKEIVEKFSEIKAEFPFRYKYSYCNIGYYFVGKCIESITKSTLSDYMRNTVFIPLQMINTSFIPSDITKSENSCIGYTYSSDSVFRISYSEFDWMAAAGGICSNTTDMARWMIEILNSVKDSSKIYPQKVIERAWRPQSTMGYNDGSIHKNHFFMYASGWPMEDYEGFLNCWGAGGTNGFTSQLSVFPENDFGILILTNRDNHDFASALKKDLINAMLGIQHLNHTAKDLITFNERLKEQRLSLQSITDSIADYKSQKLSAEFSGIYFNSLYGEIEIENKNNSLRLSFEHHPDLIGLLYPLSYNRFFCKFNYPEYEYTIIQINTSNNIPEFTLEFPMKIDSYSYSFTKRN